MRESLLETGGPVPTRSLAAGAQNYFLAHGAPDLNFALAIANRVRHRIVNYGYIPGTTANRAGNLVTVKPIFGYLALAAAAAARLINFGARIHHSNLLYPFPMVFR